MHPGKSKQHKTDKQNYAVYSPFMTLVQDTRWAYSTLPRPHGSDKQTFIWTLSIAHHNIIVLQLTILRHKFSVSYRSVTKKVYDKPRLPAVENKFHHHIFS